VKAASRAKQAFTLLEVMVAIAILAMSLTAIFASEAGSIKVAHRSRKMGLATLLVRCKMGEIEEQVAEEGLPALFDSDSDACCEGAEIDGFSCDWEIEPIVLPDDMFIPPEEEGEDPAAAPSGQKSLLQAPTDQLQEELSGVDPSAVLAGGGTSGMASAALGLVFPILKPSFEQQIRRATVTVNWKEGDVPHSFDVTQYLVSDQPIVDPTLGPNSTNPGGTNPGGTNPGGTNPGGTNPGGINLGGSNRGGG
jgi:general secretion pathway protein I